MASATDSSLALGEPQPATTRPKATTSTTTTTTMTTDDATPWGRLKRLLLTREGRVAQVYANLFVCSIYWPMCRAYERQYHSGSKFREHQPRTIRIEIDNQAGGALSGRPEWHWRGLPRLWPWLARYREFSSLWMTYVVIKYTFREKIEAAIELAFRPRLPANCFLLGRFVLTDEVKRISAILFAGSHLSWRFLERRHPTHMIMSLIYFLILDDRDIARYHSHLVAYPAPHVPPLVATRLPVGSRPLRPTAKPLAEAERLIHDVMSYRVDYKLSEIYRLRPNRSPEACQQLRTRLAYIMLASVSLYLPLVVVVASLLIRRFTQVSFVVAEYPGCNPAIERAVALGEVDGHSHRFGVHVLFSSWSDLVENVILWSESGNVCFLAPGFTYILNHDLMIYWAHLHEKIERTLEAVRSAGSVEGRAPLGAGELELERIWLDELVLDLQMQIQDMIKQIEQANCFLSDDASSFLVIWFALFGYFIYKTNTERDGRLPLVPLLTLLLMAWVVTVTCISLLTLHRRIHKSYPLICSLMAHDRSQYKENFCPVLEYFVQKRTCYTIFRLKRLTATSFLTIVGWSFSCYFLLSKT